MKFIGAIIWLIGFGIIFGAIALFLISVVIECYRHNPLAGCVVGCLMAAPILIWIGRKIEDHFDE